MSCTPPKSRPLATLLAACGLALLLALPAFAAPPASAYYRHGQLSMNAKNYDQAYADFSYALKLKPNDIQYELAAKQAQFAAANAHIEKGEQYKTAKQYPEAAAEMQKAMAIDPSNFVAGQELQTIDNLIHPPPPLPGEPVGAAAANSLQARLARAAGPVELGPVANTVIKNFTVNSDPKNAYLAVGKLAGLNVLFDNSSQGGYTNSGRVSLDLHNISLLQLLDVLDIQTDSFYTPITPNTILVANNNTQKHQQIDPTVLKVFYIKNIQAPTDLTELAQAIRGLMQPQPHIMPVASINALVMRDTPDKVAMVQRLLDDLDKAPPEVVVDVRILQVNRDVARDLGLLPPTSISIGLQTPSASSSSSTSSSTTSTSTSPTLHDLTHLNSSDYAVTIPNATLNALLNSSSTQTIQEPQLRAINGQQATLNIGQKIPVATGSFQPGVGGVGINPLVNTQFTYDNVGVNIKMTPEIEGDNTVLLKDDIQISDVDSYNNIGGIQQPVFGNREINHTIELENGQSAVMGGMMVNTVTHNSDGLPGLDSVPILGYLFSSKHDETLHSEILIILTPHIVRDLNITAADNRELDTGTENNIQLRELPAATLAAPASGTTPAAGAVSTSAPAPEAPSAPAGAAAPAAAPSTPAPTPTPTPTSASAPAASTAPARASAATPAGSTPQLVFTPGNISVHSGQHFSVQLDLRNATDAYALTFQLNYNPKVLAVAGMNLGSFLSRDGQAPALVHREDATAGNAQVSISRPPNVSGLAGSGNVVTIDFVAKASGTSPLTISRLGARDPNGAVTPLNASAGTVTVR